MRNLKLERAKTADKIKPHGAKPGTRANAILQATAA